MRLSAKSIRSIFSEFRSGSLFQKSFRSVPAGGSGSAAVTARKCSAFNAEDKSLAAILLVMGPFSKSLKARIEFLLTIRYPLNSRSIELATANDFSRSRGNTVTTLAFFIVTMAQSSIASTLSLNQTIFHSRSHSDTRRKLRHSGEMPVSPILRPRQIPD